MMWRGAMKSFSTMVKTQLSPKLPRTRTRRSEVVSFNQIKISLVGRPNVGKSTLFNILADTKDKSQKAIVSEIPGTTRDRRECKGSLGGLTFTLVDTGGYEAPTKKNLKTSIAGVHGIELLENMLLQTEHGVRESDLTLFLVDGKVGLTPEDEVFARQIRKYQGHNGTKVRVVVNKAENLANIQDWQLQDFFKLGFGEPVFVSAEHKAGLGDLYVAIEEHALSPYTIDQVEEREARLKVAILGLPNVGKSTLLNALVGSNRVITGPIAGLTRDAIFVDYESPDGQKMTLIDTAGIRRNNVFCYAGASKETIQKAKREGRSITSVSREERVKLDRNLELRSIEDSMKSLLVADVAVIVVDVTRSSNEPDSRGFLTKLDLTILSKCVDEGKPVVIGANKCDILYKQDPRRVEECLAGIAEQLSYASPQAKGLPIIALSAESSVNLDKVINEAELLYKRTCMRIPTNKLNTWLKGSTRAHPPPRYAGHGRSRKSALKLKFAAQVSICPPTFMMTTNKRRLDDSSIPENYKRYLRNSIKEEFGYDGVPIRLIFKDSSGNDSFR